MVRLSQLPDHSCGVLNTLDTKSLLNTSYVPVTLLSTRNTYVCGHAPSVRVHFPCPAWRMAPSEHLRQCRPAAPQPWAWAQFPPHCLSKEITRVFTVRTLLSKAGSEILWPVSVWQIPQGIETVWPSVRRRHLPAAPELPRVPTAPCLPFQTEYRSPWTKPAMGVRLVLLLMARPITWVP